MVIIQKRVGQLGNQLFTMAHFLAGGLEHGYKTFFPCFEYDLSEFPRINSRKELAVRRCGKKTNRFIHGICKSIRIVIPETRFHSCLVAEGEPYVDVGSQGFSSLAKSKLVACEGFGFRDLQNITKYRKEIAGVFSQSEKTRQQVAGYLRQNGCDEGVVRVGFHIRRTDYKSYRNGEFYYDDAAWLRWINQSRELFGSFGKRFVGVVFSDEDVARLIKNSDDLIPSLGGLYADLSMLSACDYIIGPPSTFSGWASYSGSVPFLKLLNSSQSIHADDFRVIDWY